MGNDDYHAITLWPEWAFAITHMDKRIENRSWAPPQELYVDRKVAIHAGRSIGGGKTYKKFLAGIEALAYSAELAGWERHTWINLPEKKDVICELSKSGKNICLCNANIPKSAIVALVEIVKCERLHDYENWYEPNSVAWRLSSISVLPDPVVSRGDRGFWYLSDYEKDAIEDQLGKSAFELERLRQSEPVTITEFLEDNFREE